MEKVKNSGIRALPVFRGYTVDIRLKEFRKVEKTGFIIIPFDSEKGDELLAEFIETLDINEKADKEVLNAIWA